MAPLPFRHPLLELHQHRHVRAPHLKQLEHVVQRCVCGKRTPVAWAQVGLELHEVGLGKGVGVCAEQGWQDYIAWPQAQHSMERGQSMQAPQAPRHPRHSTPLLLLLLLVPAATHRRARRAGSAL